MVLLTCTSVHLPWEMLTILFPCWAEAWISFGILPHAGRAWAVHTVCTCADRLGPFGPSPGSVHMVCTWAVRMVYAAGLGRLGLPRLSARGMHLGSAHGMHARLWPGGWERSPLLEPMHWALISARICASWRLGTFVLPQIQCIR